MNFKGHGNIVGDREQVIYVDDVINSTSDEESAVGGEPGATNIGGVPILILFDKDEGLEGSPERRTLIYIEAMSLSNRKQVAIFAKPSSGNIALKIKLSNLKHALNIEDDSITNNINGNNNDSIRMHCYPFYLVMGLEWQD